MESHIVNQSSVNDRSVNNIIDLHNQSPEFPFVQTSSQENVLRTTDESNVYHQGPSITTRSSISFVADEHSCLVHHAQPPTSVDSPARGKRISPYDEDDETSDNEFKLVSNRKKKAANHSNDPGATTGIRHTPIPVEPMGSQDESRATIITQENPQVITDAATRYALSRYPLPPFTIRFNTSQVDINRIKRDLSTHVINVHHIEINIIGCRRSSVRCSANECDLLIHVKETVSFALLLSKSNWPPDLAGLSYALVNIPSIPPQLSLLVRNVDLRIDLTEFELEIKSLCPDVKSVSRMKNKFGKEINLVKLELTSVESRNSLLNMKKLKVNYIVYDVTEFLAPVNVLICSKCCGIGHFRKECPDQLETCRKCSQMFLDLKQHICSNQTKCKHCNGDHQSNSNKCPVIKSFRSTLTRQMMTRNDHVHAHPPPLMNRGPNIFTGSTTMSNVYANSSWGPSNNVLSHKLDEMVKGLALLSQSLNEIIAANVKFTAFMQEKTVQDRSTHEEIEKMKSQCVNLEQNQSSSSNKISSLEISSQNQLSTIQRLVLPILEELLSFSSSLNKDKSGRPTDADLRSRLGRYRSQVVNAMEGKSKQ